MRNDRNRSGFAVLVVMVMLAVVFTAVVLAALVISQTEIAVRRAQLLQRSYADEVRIRNLLSAAVADQFEIATNPETTPLPARIQTAVTALQGSGNWGVVSQPSDAAYGQIQTFPSNPSPHAPADVTAIQDFLNPEAARLIGGSGAEWSGIGEYRFRRYDYQGQDLVIQVRTLSFPLLRSPECGPPTIQNRIAYWKPSDIRGSASDSHTPTLDQGAANAGIDEDVTLLTKFSSVPLGMFGDDTDIGALPWALRLREECMIAAPGYIFSTTGLRSYIAYCGVTHTYPLDGDLTNAPYSVPEMDGVTRNASNLKTATIDLSQVGHGKRVVGTTVYDDNCSAILVSCESGGGSISVSDSGGNATPIVVVIVGSYDPAQLPISLTLASTITRPVIFIMSHVHLMAQAAVTDVNGAFFLDTDVDFAAPDTLHVASLVYYGATAVSKGLSRIVADRTIPSSIEALAPRAIVPLTKVL